jgi:hypothetical protein
MFLNFTLVILKTLRDYFSKHTKKIKGAEIFEFIRSTMGFSQVSQLVRGAIFYSKVTPIESKILTSILCGSMIYSRSNKEFYQMTDEEKEVERLVKLGLLYETRRTHAVAFPSNM